MIPIKPWKQIINRKNVVYSLQIIIVQEEHQWMSLWQHLETFFYNPTPREDLEANLYLKSIS